MEKINWAVILKSSEHSFSNFIASTDHFSPNKLFCTSSPVKFPTEFANNNSNEEISKKLSSMMQSPTVFGNLKMNKIPYQ